MDIGFGAALPRALPYDMVSLYAKDHEFAATQEDLDEFLAVVHQMDDVYLDHVKRSMKEKPA